MALADELRAAVRGYLAGRPGASWQEFARDVGVAGLLVPEEHGGAGCGPGELAAVAEELGRVLSPYPFLQSAVMAVAAARACGADDLLKSLAGGASATVVLPGDGELRLDGDVLTGAVPYALEGELVLAYAGGALVEAVPSRRTRHVTMDESRPLQRLDFERVPARRLGSGAAWGRVRDLGIAALAAEQVGGAQRCLELAVEHAKRRHQFGRPIGSFQAIKHKLANLLLLVESARSAAWAAAEDEVAAAVAGSYCSEAYLTVAGENIQVHGGIGITWEHPAHRYFKRATSDAQLFGPPQGHRARLAAHVLGTG
ncbi:acyl-CoA dehydrogenase family protein [Nonomuraea gerenzanensis]|uniref:Butyryl-CoA dehydrogenase n=1 Tax=Nonomuraea gerenzanensis TaxID=93944 RepID=A0A1M4E3G4_9ACTN|nr:acyl-CoA dehydrogenase family protein [Nonomuraea gerenzanensis]UBU15556.1 acyl-CoA/acyl-ACP dehydrogenase [Nonomuraea gerenzanensis]SBO93324.1 Butyryl-CoA dehydrogenase [Nonomuraea gerenzanensis]